MKKIILSALLFIAFFARNTVSAQDIIHLTSGEKISSRVVEITDAEVKYNKASNPDGPIYSVKKSEVSMITYKNGETETFSTGGSTDRYTQVPPATTDKKNGDEDSKIILPPANDGVAIGKVNKLGGIDVYFLSVPLLKYTVVFNSGDLLSDVDFKSILTGGIATADVDDKMNKLVNAAYRKAEKEGKTIDALIYTGGNKAVAISYVDDEIPGQPLAKVNTINGVEVYIFAEPERSYEVISDAKAKSGAGTSFFTFGLVNSNMDDDVVKLVERLNKKNKPVDAVIYNTGRKGVGVVFK